MFIVKDLCWSLFLIQLFQHRCLPMNIEKSLRTHILKNICEPLFLNFVSNSNEERHQLTTLDKKHNYTFYLFVSFWYFYISALSRSSCTQQARNQEYFRAGEFSRNQGTSINIKNMGFFLLETFKTTLKMRNLTQDRHNQGIFPQNQGTFFQFLKKGRADLPSFLPSSYAPVRSMICHNLSSFWNSRTEISFSEVKYYKCRDRYDKIQQRQYL